MTAFDAKAHLRTSTEWGVKQVTNDINAIAADKRSECPGGSARSPLYIVAECASVNGLIAKMLRGEQVERPSSEQAEAFMKTFDTTDKALAFLHQETESLLSAIDAMDESTLGDTVQTPLGERTLFGLASIAGIHMGYHDGQLNYIQTLYGDSEMHWS